jgi:hypothetical protein
MGRSRSQPRAGSRWHGVRGSREAVAPPRLRRVDRARLAITRSSLEVEPGAPASLGVQATNLANATWPADAASGPVAFGMHLLDVRGRTLDRDFARRALTRYVGPGETIEQTFPFEAPIAPGVFILEVDLVREGEHWFGDDASPTARVVLGTRTA